MGTKTKYRKYNLNELNGEIYKDAVFYKELPIDNKDFDERLIVTYSIKYRNYLRKIREKQAIRAQKTLHNGKVHAKKVLLKLTRALEFDFLAQGQPYKDLKPSYVIFICMKDPFEKGEAIYQFQMIDKNLQLQLADEAYIMSLSQRLAS